MGRQIEFYLLPEDLQGLILFLKQHDPIVVTLRSSGSAEVKELVEPSEPDHVMTIWNRNLLSSLKRELVSYPGRTYYRVDDSLPTLQLSPSRLLTWQGKQALTSGRIYGFQIDQGSDYERWFNSVSSWIKKHFKKSPVSALRGYIGPSAMSWFEAGGVLLPMFEPPATPEWVELVGSQHSRSS